MVKKWNMKGRWIFVLLIAFFILPHPSWAQSSVFNKLKQRFDSGKIFKAQLSNEFIDSYTHDTTTTNGNIWIGKNRYKIIMKDRYILVDSLISRVYNVVKNQLIISKYDPKEDDYAPSKFLSASQHSYTIRQSKVQNYGYLIKMNSKDPFSMYKTVQVEVNNDLIPKYIKTTDQTNNVAISKFYDGKFVNPTQKMFTISYPKNADVIDLRK